MLRQSHKRNTLPHWTVLVTINTHLRLCDGKPNIMEQNKLRFLDEKCKNRNLWPLGSRCGEDITNIKHEGFSRTPGA